MGRGLHPDFYFNTVYEITPRFLLGQGIEGVILDIDNTLVYYGVHSPTEENTAWILALTAAGLQVAFVSNGYEERVTAFNAPFGFYSTHHAGKPRPGGFLRAAERMALPPHRVAVIGDQIFTDVWGGNRAGMLTLLVRPIRSEPWLRFKFKRLLERPIVRRLELHHKEVPDDR
ncbi:MAG: YqeG family HAD IIIA-type phosphatase [Clostridiales bacterium]|nr:YqeG family HAD IIIA-type phosphatase [Clostridiales bacterium]